MTDRKLPAKRNPHMPAITDDKHRQDLVAKRRLGQTELAVDAGSIGTTNATKPKNLGTFDYVHIRIPLPKDLKGSGVFHASRGHSTPEAYFMMRRSNDGYVSATGMFKSAFPWATAAEETAEKTHLKKLSGISKDEIAGNIWVSPYLALDLADEYDIRDWIDILLHPDPITSDEKKGTNIKSPPTFEPLAETSTSPARHTRAKTPVLENGASLPPPDKSTKGASPKVKSPRKRAVRSASPTKKDAPEKETKTPRKASEPKSRKRSGAAANASAEPEDAPAKTPKPRKTSKTSKKEIPTNDENVKVTIKSSIETSPEGDGEVETTRVEVETPARHPTLGLPDDAQAYLDSAKKALQEARSLKEAHQGAVSARGRKRKAADVSRDDEDEAGSSSTANEPTRKEAATTAEEDLPVAKRRKMAEIELRKERVKRRAAVGIVAGLALGATLPYVLGGVLGL